MFEGSAFRLRPERLIAAARVILACLSLLAVWMDATEPAKFANVAYGLMIGYVAYSMAVCGYAWRVRHLSRRWPVVTQAIDLAFFCLFLLFTSGPGSPFNVYFIFALMCATIRWQSKGALITAAVALSVFAGFGFYAGVWSEDPTFDARAFLIRGMYLFVTGVLLGYIGIHEQRLLREMWLLTSWPAATENHPEGLTHRLLNHAETLLDAPRVVLVWSADEDDGRQLAASQSQNWTYERCPDEGELVAPALSARAFLTSDINTKTALVQMEDRRLGLVPWTGEVMRPEIRRLIGAKRTVLSVPLNGTRVQGRLFVVDKVDAARDDLTVAGIVASVMVARLDALYLTEELREAAAMDERVRVARDLHDGVLQSFTGIGLRLAAIRTMLLRGDPKVSSVIEQLQQILTAEQRELRFLIQDMRSTEGQIQRQPLPQRLLDLRDRVEREWDIRVDVSVDVPADLSDATAKEVYHVVREGLVNAARHGSAAAATVVVRACEQSSVTVEIIDDGKGFPFTGAFTADQLAREGLGPKTLRERVEALQGSLTLESGPGGASLQIVLPWVA